jgi:hypothetical protein
VKWSAFHKLTAGDHLRQLRIGDWNATFAARIGAALLHMASH